MSISILLNFLLSPWVKEGVNIGNSKIIQK